MHQPQRAQRTPRFGLTLSGLGDLCGRRTSLWLRRSGACEATFDGENLVEPAPMARFARECGGEENSNQVTGKCGPDDAGTETQDVHIVVLHRLPRGVAVVTDGRAHAWKFVRGNRDA